MVDASGEWELDSVTGRGYRSDSGRDGNNSDTVQEESRATFASVFLRATENPSPLPYQERLALGESLPSLLDVPTGLGKTAAAILAWVWRRRYADEKIRKQTPRRLVYCLPMRVLVEQTFGEAAKWLSRLGLLAGSAQWTELGPDDLPTKHSRLNCASPQGKGYVPKPDAVYSKSASEFGDRGTHPIAVHLLLGGEEKSDWALWPDRDAILIGTQDMLISRALNRGYSAGRARWPQEFGLLNSDCLWVFDEIQLMDTSLATSLQLDAWRQTLRLRQSRSAFPSESSNHLARPCHSLWMSATMARHWLQRAIDWSGNVELAWNGRHQLSVAERTDERLRSGKLFRISKQLCGSPIGKLEKPKTQEGTVVQADAGKKLSVYIEGLARHISNPENLAASGLTLIIVNTVERATRLFKQLRGEPGLAGIPIHLIHSRFRPCERELWSEFLSLRHSEQHLLISTQVIEAGVDLSANVLYTELAPWASLLQRFGRCARYPDETGQVFWLDLDLGTDRLPVEHWARPYGCTELVAAREKLKALHDVGLQSLYGQPIESDSAAVTHLYPYDPRFVPRTRDLFDLFDTTPDLTGADVDVSRFIRDGDDLDVQVFWREVSVCRKPTKKDRPQRRELCPVPLHEFRNFAREALKARHRIWRQRYSSRNPRGMWELLGPDTLHQAIYPGQIFLLEKICGGYSTELGWTGDPSDEVVPVPKEDVESKARAAADTEESEDLSELGGWYSIEEHSRDVARTMTTLLEGSGVSSCEENVMLIAARLHDWGKAHEAFQAKLKPEFLTAARESTLQGQPAAKAPDGKDQRSGNIDRTRDAWRRDKIGAQSSYGSDSERDKRRPGHRHELASSLAILEALRSSHPAHQAFAWSNRLNASFQGKTTENSVPQFSSTDPIARELAMLSDDEFDLLLYLVASHHGKVRMSLRNSADDERIDVPDPCPPYKRQARGVRDGDILPSCRLPSTNLDSMGIETPEVVLSLDSMELGLSQRYGAPWRDRTQFLLERLGPFRLGYLEALIRAADCRASQEEDHRARGYV